MMATSRPTKPIYIFCPECADIAWISDDHSRHNQSSGVDSVSINGIHLIENFIGQNEESQLVTSIDSRQPWVPSQEGRAKQDYGPKISFLKKKVSVGNFGGFPNFAVSLFDRIQETSPWLLSDFVPVEFCILEYTPERGSYIRPHFDDKWIWGDRLITVNLLSETVLRLTREFNIPPLEIVVRMPARSLLVIYGEARYDWLHSINRYDIKSRRIAMTWREFSEEIVKDEDYKDFVLQVWTIANKTEGSRAVNHQSTC